MRIVAVFEEKDPLPSTELHSSIGNRNGLARPGQRHAGMLRSAYHREKSEPRPRWRKQRATAVRDLTSARFGRAFCAEVFR